MIVDKLGNTIFVEMSVKEQRIVVRALRMYATDLSGVLGKVRTPGFANKLESRVKQYRDMADCLEEGGEDA